MMHLENVLKTSLQDVLKTSSKTSYEDIWVRRIYSFWSGRLEDVLKMSSEDEDERHLQDVSIKTIVCWVISLNGKELSKIKCGWEILTFNKTVFNIFSNFIPHELIVCDDKDPSWFNTKIKPTIHEKIKTYKVLHKNI